MHSGYEKGTKREKRSEKVMQRATRRVKEKPRAMHLLKHLARR